jgi:NADH-quinone oxidoreductase subunit M
MGNSSLIILLPLLASLLAGFGKLGATYTRLLALGVVGIQLLILAKIALIFDPSQVGFQQIETHRWIHLNLGSLGQFVSNYAVGVDGLSLGLILLTGLISFVALWNSRDIHAKTEAYYALVLLLNASLMGCFVARDMFLFYVFFEFMLLPMYFLIGIWGGPRRNYASLKFFIYTLVGSLFILIVMLGISLAYMDPYETALALQKIGTNQSFTLDALQSMQTALAAHELAPNQIVHSFDLQALSDPFNCQPNNIFSPQSGFLLGGLSGRAWGFWLLFIGFAIKLPLVPLHTWLPDAHVEAPTPISVLLAGVLLKIGAYGWLRMAIPFFPAEAIQAAPIMAGLGVLSIIYGAYNALAMTDLKKLVAYSSVSHMGFVLLGIASFTPEGWQGAIFQLLSHGVLSALLFLVVGVLYSRTGNRQIDNFSGLATKMPLFTAASGIAIFASLGLPGFSGFIGEFFSLMGAFTSTHLTPIYAILGALGILLGAGYLLWTFQKIYLGTYFVRDAAWELPDLNRLELISLFGLGILSIAMGIFPGFIFELSEIFVTNTLKIIFH